MSQFYNGSTGAITKLPADIHFFHILSLPVGLASVINHSFVFFVMRVGVHYIKTLNTSLNSMCF